MNAQATAATHALVVEVTNIHLIEPVDIETLKPISVEICLERFLD